MPEKASEAARATGSARALARATREARTSAIAPIAWRRASSELNGRLSSAVPTSAGARSEVASAMPADQSTTRRRSSTMNAGAGLEGGEGGRA